MTAWHTELDAKRSLVNIDKKLRRHIGADVILAKLTDQEKANLISHLENAYEAYSLLSTQYIDNWNKNTAEGRLHKLTDQEIKLIQDKARQLFERYVTRARLTYVHNRNIDTNHLVNILGKAIEEQKKEDELPTRIPNILEQQQTDE